jgi:hypothetical protein
MRSNFIVWIVVALLMVSCAKPSQEKPAAMPNQSPSVQTLAIGSDSARYFFEGVIGEKARITAALTIDTSVNNPRTTQQNTSGGNPNAGISGEYRYSSSKSSLSLVGTLSADNSIALDEHDDIARESSEGAPDQTLSGHWTGTLDRAAGILRGSWTSKDGKKSLPFSLRATARFRSLQHPSLDVHCSYPVFARTELSALNDTLAAIAKHTYEESIGVIDTLRNELLSDTGSTENAENKEFVKSRTEGLSSATDIEVVYVSPRLVSTLWNVSSYSGGAHGNYGSTAMTWRIEQGTPSGSPNGSPKRVAFAELFQPNAPYQKLIAGLIIADLRKKQASSVVNREFKESDAVVTLNGTYLAWTLHPSGLTIYFSPYEVASYAEGAFEVHIPWKSLQTVLRADGIFKELLQ